MKKQAYLNLRQLKPEDVSPLLDITQATGFFYPSEVAVAGEVLEEALAKGDASGYMVQVAEQRGAVLGFVCFGPTPLTSGTWDIYWMAVHPDHQGQGVGGRLLHSAEEQIRARGGRQALIETSSRPLYEPTRRFHLSKGYVEVCRIPDFYDIGDDRVIYLKTFTGGGAPRITS